MGRNAYMSTATVAGRDITGSWMIFDQMFISLQSGVKDANSLMDRDRCDHSRCVIQWQRKRQ